MSYKISSKVIIYHDETDIKKENLNGHVFFIIPDKVELEQNLPLFGQYKISINPKEVLYTEIQNIRDRWQAIHKFHHNKISGTKWMKMDFANREFTSIGVESLKKFNPHGFRHPLFCKLAIIYYPKNCDLSLYGGADKKEKKKRFEETLLRFLLKGAIHYLFSPTNKVIINGIICDGQPGHRPLSKDRILWRLIHDDIIGRSELRDYVTISNDANIIHQTSQHRKCETDSVEYKNANFLQMADMLMGSVNYSCFYEMDVANKIPRLNAEVTDKKKIVSFPVYEMLSKVKRGINFKRSSHFR